MSQLDHSTSNICTYWLPGELLYWLNLPSYPPVWSRLCERNAVNIKRYINESKLCAYDVEIPGELWSLWGCLHPSNQIFSYKTRGKQTLGCNLIACCATKLYPLLHWTPRLLDSIVISGDRYYRQSLNNLNTDEHNISLEDLNCNCKLENISFKVRTEIVAYGALYEKDLSSRRNLAKGLIYFFSKNNICILRCRQRSLAIGRDNGKCGGDYFMYDCQSMEYPLFQKGEGVPYLLRCRTLQMLFYCLVMALEVRCNRVQFTIHTVNIRYKGTMDAE
ncbi:uncharacterized protein [Eurosta solidaginis]|uniref:uncharacterized protein n=1 Tax=Eurosta solidaginis TaxID=178769 RepID=UPI003531470F